MLGELAVTFLNTWVQLKTVVCEICQLWCPTRLPVIQTPAGHVWVRWCQLFWVCFVCYEYYWCFLSAVIGFTQNQYQLQENAIPYQLDVQVLTPPQSLVESVGITVTAAGGSAISECHDYMYMYRDRNNTCSMYTRRQRLFSDDWATQFNVTNTH